jgi:hypothetical protein
MTAMAHFDVFNGDADGICSLLQLRLATPADSVLVTGVKRDIALLRRVAAQPGDSVTVLDVSLDVNRDALVALLERGASVQYFDHHFSGELPQHPRLDAHIDPSPRVCTGVVVDRFLRGRHRVWAVVAAFGDNLPDVARDLAGSLALDDAELAALQELGDNLAYNAYGDTETDLVIPPAALYRKLRQRPDPFDFARAEPVVREISEARRRDLDLARTAQPAVAFAGAMLYILPDAPWSRRVHGTFSNELASASPDLAHAILTPNALGSYTVSIRAPLSRPQGADALCRRFPTGGGRAAAAGINELPPEKLQEFAQCLDQAFP